MYTGLRLFAKKDLKMIILANKKFRLTANSNVRDIGTNTIFTLNQEGDLLVGKYEGGKVLHGNFLAKLVGHSTFEKHFHHYNNKGALVSGVSKGTIEVLPDGRLRLREFWNEDSKDGDAIYDEVNASHSIPQEYYFNLSLNK